MLDFSPDEQACLEALFLTEPKDDRTKLTNDKGERVSGTCEWITTHEKYLQWLRDPLSQLLWISGGPGKGKTMLSIFLTEELNPQTERSHDAVLAYYFCDNKDASRRTGITILRGLILQILRQRPSLFRHILPDFQVQKETLFTSSSAQEALWRVLRSMLLDSNSTKTITYLVIDGLDECEQPSLNVFLKECRTTFSHPKNFNGTCKLILISRDLPECISEALAGYDRIRLDPDSDRQVKRDLHRFIVDRVEKLARQKNYSGELRKLLEQELLERCDGRFLWVAFVIGELEHKSAVEVLDTLESIPSGLHEVYDRLLLQIQKERREIASRILGWIVMAVRPLTLVELAVATGCQSSGNLEPHEVIRYHVEYCGALIQITGPKDEVGLIHQSVKDYLLREHPGSDPRLEIFRFDRGKLNGEITNTCLKYLHNYFLAKGQVRILGSEYYRSVDQASLERFPLLSYATLHWPEHAQHSSGYDFPLPFFIESSPSLEAWCETYWALMYGEVQPNPPPTLLHLAAMFGLLSLAEKLLSGGIRRRLYAFRYINSTSEFKYRGSTPLEWAVEPGHEGVVRLLLKNRAKINCTRLGKVCSPALRMAATHGHVGIAQLLLKSNAYVNSIEQSWYPTPLVAASANGHEGMVRLLLQAGAHVNPELESGVLGHESALGWASSRGHTSIVQLLLENEADIESKNRSGQTPLISASKKGYELIIRLLLENGADINCKNDIGQSALMQASCRGHESTVRLLLENGADIDSQNDDNSTALMEASYRGHESTVRLLLKNGADVNCKDKYGQSALMNASNAGHESIVRLLLKNGADINCKDIHDESTLMKASNEGHESTVRLLLENGADINCKNKSGDSALMFALLFNRESIIRLLLENGADANCKDEYGQSALMKASREGHESTVRLLLENGADSNCKNKYGQSALMEASKGGHESTVRLLLENEADIDSKNDDNNTALMLALLHWNEQEIEARRLWRTHKEEYPALMHASYNSIVRLLLERGADTTVKNSDGYTALYLAMVNEHDEIVRLLREREGH